MQEKEILKDEALEELGLIKDINTFSIIYEAQTIKNRRRKMLMNIFGFISAFVIIFLNLTMPFIIGFKPFILIQLILSWLIIITSLPILKKKYI